VRQVISIKVHSLTVSGMAKENTLGPMVTNTSAISPTTKNMAKVFLHGQVARSMKAHS